MILHMFRKHVAGGWLEEKLVMGEDFSPLSLSIISFSDSPCVPPIVPRPSPTTVNHMKDFCSIKCKIPLLDCPFLQKKSKNIQNPHCLKSRGCSSPSQRGQSARGNNRCTFPWLPTGGFLVVHRVIGSPSLRSNHGLFKLF